MDWTRILAYVTGSVDQELLLRNEYLANADSPSATLVYKETQAVRGRSWESRFSH